MQRAGDYGLPFHFIFMFWYNRIGCHSSIGYVIWFSHIHVYAQAHIHYSKIYGNETEYEST